MAHGKAVKNKIGKPNADESGGGGPREDEAVVLLVQASIFF